MNSDNYKSSWKAFQKLNSSIEINDKEILDIIENANNPSFYFSTERLLKNAAVFSFLILFCQNCYV
ncbi:hypothetical protein LXL81_28780 [Dyadobacter sp. CY356]|nr:hypothetical protein [Dyadobacter sp. CY356]